MPTLSNFAKILGSAITILALPVTANAADYTMKIGFVTVNDPYHTFAGRLEQEIESRTQGQIEVELYPAGQLGNAARQIEGLQFGTQEMFISPPGFFAGLHPGMQVLDAPGIFHSMDHAQAIFADPELHDAYFDLLEPFGILALAQWAYGPSAIALRAPAETLEDLQGLKVRVLASPLEQALARELGMTGVAMDFTEALPALQTGTIDGVRTALSVMAGMKFYDTAKYAFKEESGMILGGAYASKMWLDSLPDDLRATVVDTVREMQPEAATIAREAVAVADQEWRDAGVTMIELTPEQRAELFERVSPIGAELMADDPKTGPLWELFSNVVARHPSQ